MVKLLLDKTPIDFPTKFNEFTAKQLEIVMAMYHHKIEIPNAKLEILKAFFFRNWRLLFLYFKNEKLIPILDKLTFGVFTFNQRIITEAELIDFIRLSSRFIFDSENLLTKQILPQITVSKGNFYHPKTTLIGPRDELINLTFEEFIPSDFMYRMYIKTQEEEYLNKLIAILYRPKAKQVNGIDRREPFIDDESIEQRANLIAHLPITQRLIIFGFYDGCQKELIEKNPDLFPKTQGRAEFTTESVIASYQSWRSVPAEFADKPDDIRNQETVLLHTVFRFLNHKAKRNKEIKAELENQRKK
jgi:hypothetical protein